MNNVKILILDDDQQVRFNLTLYLEDEGFNCTAFESGEDALENLRLAKYDLAIVDLRLPGINGEDFIIMSSKIDNQLKFIIHTGSADYILSKEIKEIGVVEADIWTKPISNLELFTARINEKLGL